MPGAHPAAMNSFLCRLSADTGMRNRVSVPRGLIRGGDECDPFGLCGLCLLVPDGAVGHDVAAGALPSDLAAFELFLVQRRV
jgi:hypothetical protein